MTTNFSKKLSFEKKTVVFVEKEYAVHTDHKTGLLMQELQREAEDAGAEDLNERMVELVLGKGQADSLFAELEAAGKEKGSENYLENLTAVVFGLMSVLYNKPYEDFENAFKNAGSAEKK